MAYGAVRDWSQEYPAGMSTQYNNWLNGVTGGATPIANVVNKGTGMTGFVNGNGGWFNNLFGNNGIIGGLGTLGSIGMGIMQGLTGLQQLNLANKAYGLAKQQFGFQKALANRNLANQAKIINNTYDNAAQVAAGMIGGRDANGNFGFTSPSLVADYANKARQKHVDGSAIG